MFMRIISHIFNQSTIERQIVSTRSFGCFATNLSPLFVSLKKLNYKTTLIQLFSITLILYLCDQASAQRTEVFTIKNLSVDITSTSSMDARDKALKEGQLQAFSKLMKRLVLSEDLDYLPDMPVVKTNEFLSDIAVNNERNSPIRYIANLTFRFKPKKVRQFLKANKIRFAETKSKPVLLLTVFEIAAAKSLWDEPNTWRKTFKSINLREGLIPIVLPKGDLKDVRIIGAEQAVEGDIQRIREMANRYKVETVMIAFAKLITTQNGQTKLEFDVTSYSSDKRDSAIVGSFFLDDVKPSEKELLPVVQQILKLIEDKWKNNNLIQFERESVLSLMLPLDSLRDWVQKRKKLLSVAIIERIELILISRNQAVANIFYLGNQEQLELALAQEDMEIVLSGGRKVLRLR